MVPRLTFAVAVAASARDAAGTSARLARTTGSMLAIRVAAPRTLPTWRARLRLAAWVVTPAMIGSAAVVLAVAGYGQLPLAAFTIGAVSILLMRASRGMPSLRAVGRDLPRVAVETRLLVVFALLYPLATIPAVMFAGAHPVQLIPAARSPLVSINYTLLDKVALLLLPTFLFASRMGSIARQLGLRPVQEGWRWTAPVLPTAALLGAMSALTLAGRTSYSPTAIGVAFLIALVQGGFPEEIFYRCLLQTRLELLLGTVAGVGVTSLMFGFRHLPTLFFYVWLGMTGSYRHDLLLACACVFAYHAVLGVVYGCLWIRYRNAWANIGAHTLFDTLAFLPLLA